MNKKEYNKLKDSGMMWEFYPYFTGIYKKDILLLREKTKNLVNKKVLLNK